MDVDVRTVPQMRVAFAAYEGPLDRVGAVFQRVQGWVLRHNAPTEPIIGVFWEEHQQVDAEGRPEGAAIGRAEAWIEFYGESDPNVDGRFPDPVPVHVKNVPAVEVAAVRFSGPALEMLRVQDAFRAFLLGEGFRLGNETRHVYHVMKLDPGADWETEIQVPLVARPPVARG